MDKTENKTILLSRNLLQFQTHFSIFFSSPTKFTYLLHWALYFASNNSLDFQTKKKIIFSYNKNDLPCRVCLSGLVLNFYTRSLLVPYFYRHYNLCCVLPLSTSVTSSQPYSFWKTAVEKRIFKSDRRITRGLSAGRTTGV